MERMDKTKLILIGLAGVLVMLLAIILILGSCGNI